MGHNSLEVGNNPKLTYAEFTEWSTLSPRASTMFPTYNNFYTMFLDTKANHVARNKALHKRFQAEHPELEHQVTQAITQPYIAGGAYPNIRELLVKAEPLLYQAYSIMHEWVDDDEQLFV
ncbi:hypothetical protein IT413_06480 [Candidatus Peregrinibacteria bacterium]|nr:hypothetical protein [Candidatus Peregrinibacteria bacterium]